MHSDDGAFLQEYFVYFKKKQRSQNVYFARSADGCLFRLYLRKKHAIIFLIFFGKKKRVR